ncbi:MAG TPA: amidohydrolase family protein [Beutenbergiaceae bacterium]|nr:amidohydrolase family protein [Beutenbergiaceae bacterium]
MTETLTGRATHSGELIDVVVSGDVIERVEARPGDGSDVPWLLPGLVDLQVNGWAGHDVNGPQVTADEVIALVRALAASGTTTVVPTVITATQEEILTSLRAITAARHQDAQTRAAIPFVHIEGPHISAQDGPRGVHPAQEVRGVDRGEFEQWQQAAEGLVGIVTLSPHHEGAPDYIRSLVADGVIAAIGHTHASPEEIRAAVAAGASMSTHLGNGAHGQITRHPNYIWTQLDEDALTACFIADGHHLPADTLRVMLRAKGLDNSVLVSDSVALGGQEPGEYRTPVGGRVVLDANGRLSEYGTPFLAGAACALHTGVRTCVQDLGLSLADAVRLATVNPGRFTGRRGVLAPGQRADLVLLDDQLAIQRVLAGGRDALG